MHDRRIGIPGDSSQPRFNVQQRNGHPPLQPVRVLSLPGGSGTASATSRFVNFELFFKLRPFAFKRSTKKIMGNTKLIDRDITSILNVDMTCNHRGAMRGSDEGMGAKVTTFTSECSSFRVMLCG